MEQCGFDAFLLREGEDADEALAALRRLQRGLPGDGRAAAAAVPPARGALMLRASVAAASIARGVLAGGARAAACRPRTWCSPTSSRAPSCRSRSSRSTPAACTPRRSRWSTRSREPLRHRRSRSSARAEAVAEYVARIGRDAFYESVELRKRCCEIRKVEPLGARSPASAPGSPACAASSRPPAPSCAEREFDAAHGLEKFNPLATGARPRSGTTSARTDVPYNRALRPGLPLDRLRALHARRCCRARTCAPAAGGGSSREHKECGLHADDPWSRETRHDCDRRSVVHAALMRPPRLAGVRGHLHPARSRGRSASNPVLFFSGGKDSIVLLRLAEKAFRPGALPVPAAAHRHRAQLSRGDRVPRPRAPPSWASG